MFEIAVEDASWARQDVVLFSDLHKKNSKLTKNDIFKRIFKHNRLDLEFSCWW